MALNPYFLQGSPAEQRLVQDLINEHLKIFGVDVIYIPRKFVNEKTIVKEVTSSKFDDNFTIEAYVNTYEGYAGSGDILTKFGMSLRDDLNIVISKDRFEDFISPFLASMNTEEIVLASRPREGDLIYFPLGQRLFEVKFVEHEKPFYQLGKLYVYELNCELFEYEDEVIDTSIDEVDRTIEDQGYITSLQLISSGVLATATAGLTTGFVQSISLTNDGYNYLTPPTVSIGTAPSGGVNATAIAFTRNLSGSKSVSSIILTNPGYGYTVAPLVSIASSTGIGATAIANIQKSLYGIGAISIGNSGSGYVVAPTVTFSSPTVGGGVTATGIATVTDGFVTGISIINAGSGYTGAPNITIGSPPVLSGIGTYIFNEVIVGSISSTTARVKSWDRETNILEISINDGEFYPGELVVGTASSATYAVKYFESYDTHDNKYQENKNIKDQADILLDFSESNPFGTY
jgi:hypothetical protein